MREILFRGKCSVTGKWLEGCLIHDSSSAYITTVNGASMPVAQTSVCQFTGLRDKNNKKIFEYDIVRTEYGRLCYIHWYSSNSSCEWDLTPYEGEGCNVATTKAPSSERLFASCYLEVVGNLFDGVTKIDLGTLYFKDGTTEEITSVWDGNGDIDPKNFTKIQRFMFETQSGIYRYGYHVTNLWNMGVFYPLVFDKKDKNDDWNPVDSLISRVELMKP